MHTLFRNLKRLYQLLRREWLIKIDPVSYARSIGVQVGADCRLLGLRPVTFGSEPYLIKLGNHVTVTGGVRFITHDGGVWIFRKEYPNIDLFAPISIGNNAFIGLNSIIMPGVTIGDNCVIGAGSVVTKDIPANHVAAGVPAVPIRTVSEYKQKCLEQAFNIRNLPEAEKRKHLETHFILH